MDILGQIAINLIAGFIGAVVALRVGSLTKSHLEFEIEQHPPRHEGTNPRQHLRVIVHNRKLYRFLEFLKYERQPALMCKAKVTFYYLDGTPMHPDTAGIPKSMKGRWAGVGEPTKPILVPGTGEIAHVALQDVPSSVDIAPNDNEILDIVLRIDGDTDCFGWNTDGYFHPNFRNRDWIITEKRARVDVSVVTGGREFRYQCQLVNDGAFNLLPLP